MTNEPAVTIMTVAAEAGVSMKTVSRVLNNEAHVRPDTREKVMRVVEELGYQPNAAARSLAGSRSYLVGLLYDNPAQGYVGAIQSGAMAACQRAGYALLPQELAQASLASAPAFFNRIKRRGLDGIVVTAPLSERRELIEEIEKFGIAFATVGSSDVSKSARAVVKIDDAAAAHALSVHLIGLGHRDIAVVEGPKDHMSSQDRMRGVQRAFAEAGLKLESRNIAHGDFTYRSGLLAGETLMSRSRKPTAILCLNDDMAAGVMAVAHKHGISIPGELSVCGFDDSAFASVIWPPLTTVRQPLADMARAAVERILEPERDHEDSSNDVVLDFELVIRQSTAPAAL